MALCRNPGWVRAGRCFSTRRIVLRTVCAGVPYAIRGVQLGHLAIGRRRVGTLGHMVSFWVRDYGFTCSSV